MRLELEDGMREGVFFSLSVSGIAEMEDVGFGLCFRDGFGRSLVWVLCPGASPSHLVPLSCTSH